MFGYLQKYSHYCKYPCYLAALDGCPGGVDAAAEVVAGVGGGGVGDHQAVVPDHHHVALLHTRKPEGTIILEMSTRLHERPSP